jgi:hypothetical protein
MTTQQRSKVAFVCWNEERLRHAKKISDYFSSSLRTSKKHYTSHFKKFEKEGSVQDEKRPRSPRT